MTDELIQRIEKLQTKIKILANYWEPERIHYIEQLVKLNKEAESILKEYNNSAI